MIRPTKSKRKPCCPRFHQTAVRYLDTVSQDDYKLKMIANLLSCVESDQCFNIESLSEIGHMIEEFINLKIVREYYFFGRTLAACTFDEHDLKAEIQKVSGKNR